MVERKEEVLWDQFLQIWPQERVERMTLEEYSKQGSKDCFCWWLERGLEDFGKMGGVSAFKFGIYARAAKNTKPKSNPKQIWGETYAYETRFGTTLTEAYAKVHQHIWAAIQSVQREDLQTIETLPLARTLKWKIALLYQNPAKPLVFGVFTHQALFASYRLLEPDAVATDTPQHVMYTRLLSGNTSDIFTLADEVWQRYVEENPKSVPLDSHDEKGSALPGHYKIAPGEQAGLWDQWRQQGIATIGWSEFEDLSEIDVEDLARHPAAAETSASALRQIALFRRLKAGDILVANYGKSQVLGIGTVTAPYSFVPKEIFLGHEEHPHRVEVDWHNQIPFAVSMPNWAVTIRPLKKETYLALLETQKISYQSQVLPDPDHSPTLTKNIILYGPPGCGKTYRTKELALRLMNVPELKNEVDRTAVNRLFQKNSAEGRISFVTFHQAFGYEDFVEGIRPNLDKDAGSVTYKLHQGVFKRMALLAAFEGLKDHSISSSFSSLWEQLYRRLSEDGPEQVTSQKGYKWNLGIASNNRIKISPAGAMQEAEEELESDAEQDLSQTSQGYTAGKSMAELLWAARADFGPDLQNYNYKVARRVFEKAGRGKGGHAYTVYFLVHRELHRLSKEVAVQSYSDETKMDMVGDALNSPDWETKFLFTKDLPQYVLIIDEINRGNISKIFGELITLIERSKRLTHDDGLVIPLAYSQNQRFGVPPNLHILGTMNTSDRSLALLDIALRRRFEFQAQMPDAKVLDEQLQKNKCGAILREITVKLFETINRRISLLYDSDHQLGHALFFDVASTAELLGVFVDQIVPLLSEYFHGSWDKVCTILGCKYSDAGRPARTKEKYLLTTNGQPLGTSVYAQPFLTVNYVEGETSDFLDDDDTGYLSYTFDREALIKLNTEAMCRLLLGVLSFGNEEKFQGLLGNLVEETQIQNTASKDSNS